MYNRQQTITDRNAKLGIDIATLDKADVPCVVCGMLTLKVIGKWKAFNGNESTQYICTDDFCNCVYSMAR